MNMDEQHLPPGWELATIGEVTVNKVSQVAPTTEITYIDIGSVNNATKSIEDAREIGDLSQIPSRARQVVGHNDVLVSMTRPNLNAVAKVPEELNGAIASTGFDVLRAIEVSPSWIFNVVRGHDFVEAMSDVVQGALYPAVRSDDIRSFQIPIPPLPEQRRIVAKIEALQERSGRAAKALEEVGPLLEQFRQSILAAAFSGRLTANWREKNPNVEPAHELLARIRTDRRHRWEQAELAKYEAKGKQPPKDWRGNYEEPNATFDENASVTSFQIDESCYWAMAPLESLVDPERNVPYGIVTTGDPHEDGVPTVRCGDIKRFSIAFTNLKRVHPDVHSQYRRTWLEGGEVLIAIRGTIGATAVVPAEMKGMNISREVALIPLLEGIDPYFMMYLLASPAAQSLITGQVKGVAQSGINLSDLRLLPTPVPPLHEQIEIRNRLTRIMATIDALGTGAIEFEYMLSQLNQSILAKAFRGELVPQDPNDEPASELLARIRRGREVSGDGVQGSGRKKKAEGKGSASESARPAKRSKRSSKADSATTTEASADTSPEPARPQRRRRRSSSNNADASLVIRVLAEGGAVNIHADTSGPTVQFYTKSSGGGLLAEIEDIPESALKPRESKRVTNLSNLMDPDLALLHPVDVNETYLPQLRNWYTWAAPQLPEHFESEFLEQAKSRWLEALEISAVSGTAAAALRRSDGRLFDS